MTTLLDARRAAVARLMAADVPGAAQDAVVLISYVLGIGRSDLALLPAQTVLTDAQAHALDQAVSARVARRPISHITGQRLFWGRAFGVTPDVLDPRPETESLVAAALAAPFSSVLDLGTGSGCILLTLLAERPGVRGLGVDLSVPALAVARRNAAALGVQADFAQGSWFDPVQGLFDLIVSNPPYISADEMAGLSPEVLAEPHVALTPGGDGLAAYRIICATAPRFLVRGGRLLVEIGAAQGPAVAALFATAGFEDVQILPDMDGRDRVVLGRFTAGQTP